GAHGRVHRRGPAGGGVPRAARRPPRRGRGAASGVSALLGGAGGQPFSAAGRRPLAPVAGFGTALLSSGGIGGRARSLAGPLEAVSFGPVGGLSPRRSWRARRRTGHRSPSSRSCPR